jgi:hypothetical protein
MGFLLGKKALVIVVIVVILLLTSLSFYFFRGSLPILGYKPGKCLVLEEKFCYSGEIVKEGTTTYIGFNLPIGTAVYSRTNGTLDKTKEDGAPFSGYFAGVRDAVGGTGTMYRGNLQFDNLFSKEIKAGELIGYITEGNKSLGYDLLITITKRTPAGPIVDETGLMDLFKR